MRNGFQVSVIEKTLKLNAQDVSEVQKQLFRGYFWRKINWKNEKKVWSIMAIAICTFETFCQKYFWQHVSLRRSGKSIDDPSPHHKINFEMISFWLGSLKVHFQVILSHSEGMSAVWISTQCERIHWIVVWVSKFLNHVTVNFLRLWVQNFLDI